MPAFQLLHCDVALAGDVRAIVHRGDDSPVTFPELVILEAVHGQGSLSAIQAVGTVERSHAEERKRLNLTYGYEVVNGVFAGVHSPLPLSNPDMQTPAPVSEPEPEPITPIEGPEPAPVSKPKTKSVTEELDGLDAGPVPEL